MKPEQQPDAWRFRYPGGKWTVQKNRPAWYRDHMSDVELEPLFSQAALLEAEQRKQAEIDRLNAVIARMQQTMSIQAEQWTRSMSEAHQRGRRMGMEEAIAIALDRSPDDDNLDWQVRQQVAAAIRAKLGEVQK